VHEWAPVEAERSNPSAFRLLQAASRDHNVKVCIELQVSPERVGHHHNEYANTVSSFYPLLDHRRRECGQVVEELAVLPKDWPKNVGHRKADTRSVCRETSERVPLSKNSLKRIQSVLSGVFALAKQLGYYEGVNPLQDTRVDPRAAEPAETYAYSLEEVQALVAVLPEPAATAFAVAAFMGLRIGEIEALQWEDYRDGEMHIARSIWNGHVGALKTRKSAAPVPVIRQLAERLKMHRLHSQNPQTGPIFANSSCKPMSMNNLLGRVIRPALNRCAGCGIAKGKPHLKADHEYQRDARLPQWHGWHAARRGLGSNLYRLGVPPMVIQRILRHSNVSTTANYYIKTAADDVRNAMAKFEKTVTENPCSELQDTFGTLEPIPSALPESIN
jgi:integrase